MSDAPPNGNPARRVALFGSTGSIGRSTLEVAAAARDRVQIAAISAHSQWNLAAEQARRFRPRWLVATGPDWPTQWQDELPDGVEVVSGLPALESIARSDGIDTVVAAIVGIAGLASTWAAVESGKRVALANKETMVAAGPLMTELARASGAEIIPVDSEHSAIFQALAAGRRGDVKRVVLTASGGPFRGHSWEQLQQVNVADALAHPTWRMGRKISIDSATLMNKALEIVEARWLFELEPSQIDVVIHPQSIVHSLVEFIDGSMIAQLSSPDMRLPIQYALSYPDRWTASWPTWNFQDPGVLEFEDPDVDRFPAIALGMQAARDGGTSGVVLNAANEAAVAQFCDGAIPFSDIVPACQAVLQHHDFDPHPTLSDIFTLDHWAREEMNRWICA